MSAPAADRLVADRYVLKAPLGRGGMGVVWRAQDAVLGREVAVKEVVFPTTMPEEERRPARARVMREARAAARLNHPGAVTLYDVVQDHGGTFIVMELVNAPTLADLVRTRGPLPAERVAEIGAQVASALEAAHAAGIVHRDVKPGNVMVGERGTAKLADFGVASLQGDPQLTSTGLVIGSPAYMAPEQARGEESGPPADFWALGATMFYAVEGEPPFDRGTSIATLAAVVNEPPRSPRRAGPLAALLNALLAKDPAARPSGPALRAELDRLATRPSPPTEVLPVHGPGRTVQLPPPAAPVDSRGQPQPPPATLPLRGTSPREAGVPHASATPPQDAGPPPTPAAAPGAAGAPPAEPGRDPGGEPATPAAGGGVTTPASGGGATPASREGVGAFEPATREPERGAAAGRPVLPPAPPVERTGRGRMVGVVALLVVLGLAGVLLAVNLRSGGGGEPTAASRTTAAGGGTRPTATTGRASSTTAPGTTAAPTTAAAAGLPAGWTEFTNRRGANRVGVPPGFRARTRERFNATVVEEEGGARRVITVRSQNPSAPLPQASRDYRAGAPERFKDYREVSYQENQAYAGLQGAVVFEYEATIDGRRVHVRHVNVKGRTWGYNVELIVPVAQWDASQTLARQFEQAFRPLG
jgi:eukaryotic-like serine/threonine-protein kinase